MINFPFTEESMQKLFGKEMRFARNIQERNEFLLCDKLVFQDNGVVSSSGSGIVFWKIDHGQLILLDEMRKVRHVMKGIETQNDSVYVTGTDNLVSDTRGYARVCMWEFQSMPLDRFGICVSSHYSYYKETLSRLLRSLWQQMGMDKVKVFVGGTISERRIEDIETYGAELFVTPHEYWGWTALKALMLSSGVDYWLLLHDTCEVSDKFMEKIGQVDSGLRFDAILLTDLSRQVEIGFWNQDFIMGVQRLISHVSLSDVFTSLIEKAQMVTSVSGLFTLGVSVGVQKDVYGRGTQRRVVEYRDLGIKKFLWQTGENKP